MLSRLIVDAYAWIIEISLWLTILLASIVGYHYAVPILNSILWNTGLILESHLIGKIVGALIFALAAFLAAAVVMGPILVIFDIRKSIRTLEMGEGSVPSLAQRGERKEPTL